MKTRGGNVKRIITFPSDIVRCFGCSTNHTLSKNVVRFLDFVFCNVNCFGEFFLNRQRCVFCKDLVTDKGMKVLSSTRETLKFCDSLCLEMYKAVKDVCWICSVAARNVSRRNNEFCSHKCEEFYRRATDKVKIQVCGECKEMKEIKKQVKVDYKAVNICSDECLKNFREYHKLRLKSCVSCKAMFETHVKHFVLMDENEISLFFCSHFCMKYFVNNFKTEAICKRCGNKDSYFKMIKIYDEIYCSIACLFDGKKNAYQRNSFIQILFSFVLQANLFRLNVFFVHVWIPVNDSILIKTICAFTKHK